MSLEPIKSDLFEKAANLTKQGDDMEAIKQIIIDHTRISIRITSIKNGVIRVKAENSSAASDLFLSRTQLLERINKDLKKDYKRLQISS